MLICLFGIDKKPRIEDWDVPAATDNPAIMALTECFYEQSGVKYPIYIPRMGPEATKELCDYLFKRYGNREA